jgi:hypothetical protein
MHVEKASSPVAGADADALVVEAEEEEVPPPPPHPQTSIASPAAVIIGRVRFTPAVVRPGR